MVAYADEYLVCSKQIYILLSGVYIIGCRDPALRCRGIRSKHVFEEHRWGLKEVMAVVLVELYMALAAAVEVLGDGLL
jgi:hypothetical protein